MVVNFRKSRRVGFINTAPIRGENRVGKEPRGTSLIELASQRVKDEFWEI
jgi:hypothetical protein